MIKNERGFSLIEVLIAIALMGIIGVAFAGALSTASKAILIADERATAESLARSQMEYVKNAPYQEGGFIYEIPPNPPTTKPPPWDITYTTLDSCYAGYSVKVNSVPLNSPDDGIQKITVTVSHHEKSEVITLDGYKVER